MTIFERNKINRLNLLLWFIVIFLFSLPFFWFNSSKIIAGGEIYSIINPTVIFNRGLFTWTDSLLGLPNMYFIASVYHLITYILSIIFPISIVQKVIIGLFLSLSFLSFYSLLDLLLKKQNKLALILGSLFYVFNPFYVMIFPWFPTYGFLFILAPWIFKLIYEFFNFKVNNIKKLAEIFIAFFIFSTVALNMALFGIIIIIIILFLFFQLVFLKPRITTFLRKTALIFIVFILANIFWLLPFFTLYKSTYGDAVVHESNFSEKSIFDQPTLKALTLNEYYWFDKKNTDGTLMVNYSGYYGIPSQLICLTLIALVVYSIFILKNNKLNKKNIYFFIFIFLLGVFLTKGTAPPLGWIYRICLEKIKFFGIYRASDIKFPYLVVFSFSFLISYSLIKTNKTKKIIRNTIFLLISIMILFLGMPFILNQTFNKESYITIPGYWKNFSKEIDDEKIIGRVLLTPKNFSPFDNYKWGYEGASLSDQIANNKSFLTYSYGYGSSVQESNISLVTNSYNYLEKGDMEKFLKSLAIFNVKNILQRDDFNLISKSNSYEGEYSFWENGNINNILKKNFEINNINEKLHLYNLPSQYFLPLFYIPQNIIYSNGNIESLSDMMSFEDYNIRSGIYLETNQLSDSTNLKKRSQASDPKLQVPNITFIKINPTKYRIKVEGAKEPYTLVFSESFEQGWKAYIDKAQNDYGKTEASYFDGQIKEGTHKNIFLDKTTFETLGKKAIPEEQHLLVNGYANSWYVTTGDSGGSENYEIIIEFWPQRLFYMGLLISGLTLVGFLVYLIYDYLEKKKKKKIFK